MKRRRSTKHYKPHWSVRTDSEILTTSATYGKWVTSEDGSSEFIVLEELPLEQREIKVHKFIPFVELGKVSVGVTLKHKMDYNNSFDVFTNIAVPCYKEELAEAHEYAKREAYAYAVEMAHEIKERVRTSDKNKKKEN